MTTCVVTFPEIGQEVSFHSTVLLWDLFPPLKMSCHGLENVNRTSITIGLSSNIFFLSYLSLLSLQASAQLVLGLVVWVTKYPTHYNLG